MVGNLFFVCQVFEPLESAVELFFIQVETKLFEPLVKSMAAGVLTPEQVALGETYQFRLMIS